MNESWIVAIGDEFYTGYGMSKYPYYFLDIDKIGIAKSLLMIGGFLVVYIAIGYSVCFANFIRKLAMSKLGIN